MADDSRLRISAVSGLYDSIRQFLKLNQDVHLRSPNYDVTLVDRGHRFQIRSLPLGPAGDRRHQQRRDDPRRLAEARDNGAELTFIGHVRSTFVGDAVAAPSLGNVKGTAP